MTRSRLEEPRRISLYDALGLPPGTYRIWLTPHDAEELLKANAHNRPVNKSDVLKWTMEMREGRWRFNGDTFRLDDSANVLDGQHRLIALAQQEKTFRIDALIVTGLPKEVQSTIDQGRKRAVNDQLTLAGIDSDKSFASAVRAFMVWQNGWFFVDNRQVRATLTAPRIVEWAEKHPDEIALIRDGARFKRIAGVRPALTMCTYAIIAQGRGHMLATDYFQRLLDGAGLTPGSPILALRNRLNRIAAEKIRWSDRETVGTLINVFNIWNTGGTMHKVQPPKAGYYTEKTFPKVK